MEIIIYTIPTCPWSDKLRKWLKKKKLTFEDRDLYESQNGAFRDEVLEKSNQLALPVSDIGGEIVIGFNEKKLEEAINKAKSNPQQ